MGAGVGEGEIAQRRLPLEREAPQQGLVAGRCRLQASAIDREPAHQDPAIGEHRQRRRAARIGAQKRGDQTLAGPARAVGGGLDRILALARFDPHRTGDSRQAIGAFAHTIDAREARQNPMGGVAAQAAFEACGAHFRGRDDARGVRHLGVDGEAMRPGSLATKIGLAAHIDHSVIRLGRERKIVEAVGRLLSRDIELHHRPDPGLVAGEQARSGQLHNATRRSAILVPDAAGLQGRRRPYPGLHLELAGRNRAVRPRGQQKRLVGGEP